MALGAFEFTAEQVEVLRAEQANPNCKFAGVDDLGRCTDEAMIVQMGAALRRASVELTEEQQRALGAASEFTYTDMAQRGNRDFEAVRIPDPEALTTEQLIETREYARDVETDSLEEVIAGCVASLRRYGFCVVDHVVPREMVPAVYHELSAGMEETMAQLSPEERQRPGPNGTTMGANEIIYQPLYQQSLCHPAVVGIAKTMLDAHVRIAQCGRRNVASDDQAEDGLGGYGPAANRGPLGREWHTCATAPLLDPSHSPPSPPPLPPAMLLLLLLLLLPPPLADRALCVCWAGTGLTISRLMGPATSSGTPERSANLSQMYACASA